MGLWDRIEDAAEGVLLTYTAANDWAASTVLGVFNSEWGDDAPMTAAAVELIRSQEEGRDFDADRWRNSSEGGLALIEQATEETAAEVGETVETFAAWGGVALAVTAVVVVGALAVIYLPRPRG